MSNFNDLPPYGLNTMPDGRYNLYASNTEVDFAEQSESHLIKWYIELIKSKLMPKEDSFYANNNEDDAASEEGEVKVKTEEAKTNPIPEIVLLESTMEKLVLNAEERVRRSVNTLSDPNHTRSHTNPADKCFDGDCPSTSMLNFTTMLNLAINNSMALNE